MDNVPCKHYEHWTENQSPLGSGLNWPMDFADCGFNPPDDWPLDKIDRLEAGPCDKECPAYEPMAVKVCEKHGEFIEEYGCDSCMADAYFEDMKLAAEYDRAN